MCGNVNRAAVNINIAVGIYCICVALSHYDSGSTAVKLDSRSGVRAALLRGVDTVIRSGDLNGSVIDLNIGGFYTLGCLQCKAAAVYLNNSGTLNSVTCCGNVEGAVINIDSAFGVILAVFTV